MPMQLGKSSALQNKVLRRAEVSALTGDLARNPNSLPHNDLPSILRLAMAVSHSETLGVLTLRVDGVRRPMGASASKYRRHPWGRGSFQKLV